MKLSIFNPILTKIKSLPVRGAWIEIKSDNPGLRCPQRSLPVRGAWIEMPVYVLDR